MKEILKQILDAGGFSYTDIIEEKCEDNTRLNIETENPKEYIGSSGEVIRAIQHLLRVILWRNEVPGYVIVDADGYRKNQEENVRKMTEMEATKVIETGESIEMPAMAPDKRRVVHMVVKNDFPDLDTESIDHGDRRRVLIRKK